MKPWEQLFLQTVPHSATGEMLLQCKYCCESWGDSCSVIHSPFYKLNKEKFYQQNTDSDIPAINKRFKPDDAGTDDDDYIVFFCCKHIQFSFSDMLYSRKCKQTR